MSFRLVSKSVTLNDLERRNGFILRYFTEFVYDVVVKKFTFAISSSDEFLVVMAMTILLSYRQKWLRAGHPGFGNPSASTCGTFGNHAHPVTLSG